MRRTITVEIKPQRGRVLMAGEKLVIENAAGGMIQFHTDDLNAIAMALMEAGIVRGNDSAA